MDAVIYVLTFAMFLYTCMCVVICCVGVAFNGLTPPKYFVRSQKSRSRTLDLDLRNQRQTRLNPIIFELCNYYMRDTHSFQATILNNILMARHT